MQQSTTLQSENYMNDNNIDYHNNHGRNVGYIVKTNKKENDLKSLVADRESKVEYAFDEEHITDVFNKAINTNSLDYIYIVPIYFKNQKQKLEKTEIAMNILEQLNTDVIGHLCVNLDDYIYLNNTEDYKKIDVNLKALYRDEEIGSNKFSIKANMNKKQYINEDIVKNLIKKNKMINQNKTINTQKGFEDFYNQDASKNISIKDFVSVSDDNIESKEEGVYTTKVISAEDIINSGYNIHSLSIKLNAYQKENIELYCFDGSEEIKINNLDSWRKIDIKDPYMTYIKIVFHNHTNPADSPKLYDINLILDIEIGEDYIDYKVGTNNEYVDAKVKNKNSFIELIPLKEKYKRDFKNKKFFYKKVSQISKSHKMVSVVKPPQNDSYSSLISLSNEIKSIGDNLGRYIACTINEGVYTEGEGYNTIIPYVALYHLSDSSESVINNQIKNIEKVISKYNSTEIENLKEFGYTVIEKTVRHGITAVNDSSFGDSSKITQSLNTIRIINETIKRLEDVLNDFIGEVFVDPEKITESIDEEIQSLIDEDKLVEASYTINEITESSVGISLELRPQYEINNLNIPIKTSV